MHQSDGAKRSRDNFSDVVRERLAAEVGYRCSIPECGAPTIGPSTTEPKGFGSSGVAAHITAAARGGPRFDDSLTAEQRSSPTNGIHCCAKHGRIVDNDPDEYSVAQLRSFKAEAIDLQRRAHSTGDIDPNGRIKLARVRRHEVAANAMKAGLRIRAAIMSGLHVADNARDIRTAPSNRVPVINAAIERWANELTRARADLDDATIEIRVVLGRGQAARRGISPLADLLGLQEEWRTQFQINLERILGQPGAERENIGPCDWRRVFRGDQAEREKLQVALDTFSQQVEAWAAQYIVTRED